MQEVAGKQSAHCNGSPLQRAEHPPEEPRTQTKDLADCWIFEDSLFSLKLKIPYFKFLIFFCAQVPCRVLVSPAPDLLRLSRRLHSLPLPSGAPSISYSTSLGAHFIMQEQGSHFRRLSQARAEASSKSADRGEGAAQASEGERCTAVKVHSLPVVFWSIFLAIGIKVATMCIKTHRVACDVQTFPVRVLAMAPGRNTPMQSSFVKRSNTAGDLANTSMFPGYLENIIKVKLLFVSVETQTQRPSAGGAPSRAIQMEEPRSSVEGTNARGDQ